MSDPPADVPAGGVGGDGPDPVGSAVADAYRREWAFVLAATARVTRDLDLAEECTADAFAAAVESWRRDGVPLAPGAWLTTTARRRGLDELRRRKTLRAKLPLLLEPVSEPATVSAEAGGVADDRLRLVFTCCHPALAREAQVALTLRLVCGLPTTDVARAFLVAEATMAARVTRAKKKIAAARIPYRVPGTAELPERLDAVLTVVHLLFAAGHTAATGERLVRDELVHSALALARTLVALMPDEREALALLALILLTDARRAARVDATGDLVLLEDQDRSTWDPAAIEEGRTLARSALRGGRPGRFALQAAIAAVHSEAKHWTDTDWEQIVGLYDLLLEAWPTPVVALNRAVALAMAVGPQTGLDEIARIEAGDSLLAGYRYLPAARADLLRRLGRNPEAAAAYRDALALTADGPERRFLLDRLEQVGGSP